MNSSVRYPVCPGSLPVQCWRSQQKAATGANCQEGGAGHWISLRAELGVKKKDSRLDWNAGCAAPRQRQRRGKTVAAPEASGKCPVIPPLQSHVEPGRGTGPRLGWPSSTCAKAADAWWRRSCLSRRLWLLKSAESMKSCWLRVRQLSPLRAYAKELCGFHLLFPRGLWACDSGWVSEDTAGHSEQQTQPPAGHSWG